MRDLRNLHQKSDPSIVNKALELNGKITKLENTNSKLRRSNERYQQQEEELVRVNESQREALLSMKEERKAMMIILCQQKKTMDSLFEDLERSHTRILALQEELLKEKGSLGASDQAQDTTSPKSQADLLTAAVFKANSGNGFFPHGSGGALQAIGLQSQIRHLQSQKEKLETEIIQLQTNQREELHRNCMSITKLIEENHSVAKCPSDASTSSRGGLVEVSLDSSSHFGVSSTTNSATVTDKSSRPSSQTPSVRRIQTYHGKWTMTKNKASSGASEDPAASYNMDSPIKSKKTFRKSKLCDIDSPDKTSNENSRNSPRRTHSLWPAFMSPKRRDGPADTSNESTVLAPRRIRSLPRPSFFPSQYSRIHRESAATEVLDQQHLSKKPTTKRMLFV